MLLRGLRRRHWEIGPSGNYHLHFILLNSCSQLRVQDFDFSHFHVSNYRNHVNHKEPTNGRCISKNSTNFWIEESKDQRYYRNSNIHSPKVKVTEFVQNCALLEYQVHKQGPLEMINQWIAAAELAEEHHPHRDGWHCIIIKHTEEVLCDSNCSCVPYIMTFTDESRA